MAGQRRQHQTDLHSGNSVVSGSNLGWVTAYPDGVLVAFLHRCR
jgi:hypothetical protein